MSFQEAYVKLLEHEGGYNFNPNDPGGETNWGISKRAYPAVDIAKLTMNEAGEIYKRDYWDKLHCDSLGEKIAFQLFDAAVNSGVNQATKWLQRAVNVEVDGIFGKNTLAASKLYDESTIVARFNGHRLAFMADLNNFDVFGRGWARRIAKNLKEA
jgi:lysozyme family protein